MQFHLNGFRAGDPGFHEAAVPPRTDDQLPAELDVLVVGCGPAGLTLAAQLSAFPHIATAIIEQKDGPLQLGQADGVACRTMEMFEAFGFADQIKREAYWVNETTFWKPAPDGKGIVRNNWVRDVEDGLSEMPHVILNQARVHDRYLDVMRNSPRRMAPFYARRITGLERRGDGVIATIENLATGQSETVRARYIVGCDGARSTVREAIGRSLKGDSLNQAWGVMDVLAVTDFPDIRFKTAIQSPNDGSILIIPREGGYLTRFYIELDEVGENERIADRDITVEALIARAQRILAPYALDVREVAWWSAYVIGHRICDRFDDVADDAPADALPRIFIAGDACHTHSPKAGQGMNVSMQDTFNLGWKLAAVMSGQARPELLRTYTAERQSIAQDLIDFDRAWATLFSAEPKSAENPDGVDPAELRAYFVKGGRYTAGVATRYRPSMVTGGDQWQGLATGLTIGMRFHSAKVTRVADGKPLHLGHEFAADGRWRLLLFAGAGDTGAGHSPIARLAHWLAEDPASPVRKYTRAGADIDSLIDVRAVFQQAHRDVAIDTLPALLRPAKGGYGLHDYEKVYSALVRENGAKETEDFFTARGIDRQQGAMVLIRPDQYVAHVLPLDGETALAAFLDGILLPA